MLDYILINMFVFFLSKIALLVISAMSIFSDKNEVRLSFLFILANYFAVPLSFHNNIIITQLNSIIQ